jgi:adenosylcobalamin-dependent ribonucleoside-triphosphate reductase
MFYAILRLQNNLIYKASKQMTTNKIRVRALHPGMGQAVAERTVLRKLPIYEMQDGDFVETGKRFETWGEVADRVATGNALLHPDTYAQEKPVLEKHIANMSLLMSGRHLQHGDSDQPNRNLEVFSNCSTAAMSFALFMLLLNGSGVGRSYDDDMALVNWNHAPNLRVVLDTNHKDFNWSQDESVRDAKHKYNGDNVIWHEVADTREGWAKAIETWETLAYQKVYADHTLVLDFSKVRPEGSPIMGMQGRPSSGPKPLMNALMKCATIKGAGMRPWKQALYMDHYLAECVLVGGARRAARMATKFWRDRDILDFIHVKRPIEYQGMTMEQVAGYRADLLAQGMTPPQPYLWSANNSVLVDAEFWDLVKAYRTAVDLGKRATKDARQAWVVLTAIAEAAYGDGTGEPGLINVDKLVQNDTGWEGLEDGAFVQSKKYQVDDETRLIFSRLAKIVKAKKYRMIVNPCGEIALSVLGAYCIIADVVPFFCGSYQEIEEVFRAATRALIRVNLMDNLYARETARTNRIGIGLTGIHEFAWKFYKIGFRDLVNPDFSTPEDTTDQYTPRQRAAAFWSHLSHIAEAVDDEARSYSAKLGVNMPHTTRTIKPAGTTSKLAGLTEGAHLPAMAHYLRWVQFRHDDPLVKTYKDLGYPTRDLQTYSGTTIVGFPTQPVITSLGMGDALVTAHEATPEEQYKWIELLEEYWIGKDTGNQVSYTLKYDPKVVGFKQFLDTLIDNQSKIRCCSVMPVEDATIYEYLPEEMITKARYEELVHAITVSNIAEDIAFEHLDCATGACPVDFVSGDK